LLTSLSIALLSFIRSVREAVHPTKWKAKYGGMEVSDAKRLKALEDENRRLKKLLAESMLDNAALKDILGKNG
jgi:putative transposase